MNHVNNFTARILLNLQHRWLKTANNIYYIQHIKGGDADLICKENTITQLINQSKQINKIIKVPRTHFPPLSPTHVSREWQWNNDADVEDPTFILPIQHCSSCTDIRRDIITANRGLLIGPRRGGPADSARGSRDGRGGEGGRARQGQGSGRRTRCGRSVWDRRSRAESENELCTAQGVL